MSVVLVTGAGRGIGLETVRQLVQRGHTVYAGIRDPEINSSDATAAGGLPVALDVTSDESVAAALAQIGAREGRLDRLVNNAGIANGAPGVNGLIAADALRVFDTNVVGTIRVTQAALPWLRRSSDAAIVNVGSGLGSFTAVTDPDRTESQANFVAYSASKAAVSMLAVQYAKALPGIRVTVVEPGHTATRLGGDGGQPVERAADLVVGAVETSDGATGTFVERGGLLGW